VKGTAAGQPQARGKKSSSSSTSSQDGEDGKTAAGGSLFEGMALKPKPQAAALFEGLAIKEEEEEEETTSTTTYDPCLLFY
jgi:hypothetical protein